MALSPFQDSAIAVLESSHKACYHEQEEENGLHGTWLSICIKSLFKGNFEWAPEELYMFACSLHVGSSFLVSRAVSWPPCISMTNLFVCHSLFKIKIAEVSVDWQRERELWLGQRVKAQTPGDQEPGLGRNVPINAWMASMPLCLDTCWYFYNITPPKKQCLLLHIIL